MNIIDHNVNTSSITEKDEIVLDESTYTIRHLIEPCNDLKLSLSLPLDDVEDSDSDDAKDSDSDGAKDIDSKVNDSDEYVNIVKN